MVKEFEKAAFELENVKMFPRSFCPTSNFEVGFNIIVIAKAGNRVVMATSIQLRNIEEEQHIDRATVEQIARIIRFLKNIED